MCSTVTAHKTALNRSCILWLQACVKWKCGWLPERQRSQQLIGTPTDASLSDLLTMSAQY
jgi:hypothetical protein